MIKRISNLKYYTLDILLVSLFFILISMFLVEWGILIALGIFLLYRLMIWSFARHNKKLASYIHLYSALVEGFKRRGKDLFMQVMIYLLYGRKYKKIVKRIHKKKYSFELIEKLMEKYEVSEKELLNYLEILDFSELTQELYLKAYFYCEPLYLSTIDYGYGARIVSWHEFKLYSDKECKKELTYVDFIQNEKNINAKKIKSFEGKNLFSPDLGTTFPASFHGDLMKKYPSLPIFFMLCGQLYDMNIIANAQYINLLWDKLRNQQDITIRIEDTNPRNKSFLKVISPYLPFFRKYMVQTMIVYTKQESAAMGLLPFKPSPGIKDRKMIKMEKEKYESEHGKIIRMRVLLQKKWIQYDTRAWHYKVFKFKAPR